MLVVQEATVESLHRHIDAITAAKRTIGPWPDRSTFFELGVLGVYAASPDRRSWIVSLSTSLGALALVVWTMGLGAGRKPLVRRELIGEAVAPRRNAPPGPLALFWRSDIDANQRVTADEAAFAEAHELTEHARIVAAIELLRAVVGKGLFEP